MNAFRKTFFTIEIFIFACVLGLMILTVLQVHPVWLIILYLVLALIASALNVALWVQNREKRR